MSADLVDTAEGGWHGAELLGARAGGAEILGVVVVVANGVKKTLKHARFNLGTTHILKLTF